MRRVIVAVVTAVLAIAPAIPAAAHAERVASTPEEGATLTATPQRLSITFTEPPSGDAAVAVLDGCGRDVVADVEVQNYEIAATLAGGQPGGWTVQTSVISVVDGHNTRDRWAFVVRGKADCSAPVTAAPEAGRDLPDEGGGSSAPLIALGAATVVLIAVGVVLRGRG